MKSFFQKIGSFFKRIFSFLWKHKWKTLILLLILGGLSAFLVKKYLIPAKPDVFVSENEYVVATGSIKNELNLNGNTQFAYAQKLTFANKGRVVSISTKIGDRVKKGQSLAQLATDELDKELKKARMDLENEQIKLKKKLSESNRELDLLEAQSNYDLLLIKKKILPDEQKLALEERERAMKLKEKEYLEAQTDYNELLSGKAGANHADLAVSSLVRSRNRTIERLIKDFYDSALDIDKLTDTYDELLLMTSKYREKNSGISIWANNQSLLEESKAMFWEVAAYIKKLNLLYDQYKDVAPGQITENELLSGHTIFKELGTKLKEWGQVNRKMFLESVGDIKTMESYADTFWLGIEKQGYAYIDKYYGTVDALAWLKDSDSTLEDSETKMKRLKLELDKSILEHETFAKNQVLEVIKLEKEITQAKTFVEQVKEGSAEQDQLDMLKNNIDQLQFNVTTLLKRYDEYKIISNFDGIVTKLEMQVGDSIGSDRSWSEEKYIYVETPDLLEINIDVDQMEIVKIQLGMPVEIVVDAFPDIVYTGSFAEIDTMPQWSSYKTKVVFSKNSEDEKILGGMSARVTVTLQAVEEVMTIPNTAIADSDGKKVVVLQQGEKRVDQEVEIGVVGDNDSEVLTGLALGNVIKKLYITQESMDNLGIGQSDDEDYW